MFPVVTPSNPAPTSLYYDKNKVVYVCFPVRLLLNHEKSTGPKKLQFSLKIPNITGVNFGHIFISKFCCFNMFPTNNQRMGLLLFMCMLPASSLTCTPQYTVYTLAQQTTSQ